MWLGSLGFMPLTLAEADALDPVLISPDPDSAQLIKKSLVPGCAPSYANPTPDVPLARNTQSDAALPEPCILLCILLYLTGCYKTGTVCAWRQLCFML